MSEDEDYDELPPINVNTSLRDSSLFSMPSAEALAEERARAAACERELLRLREEHARADLECARVGVTGLAHSDSSGSEGEAALAAAVGAMRVRAGAAGAPRPAALVAALLPHVPPPAPLLTSYLNMLNGAGERTANRITDELVGELMGMAVASSAAGEAGEAWDDDELVEAVAWLCAVASRAEPSRRAARALHLLLDDVATDAQVEAARRVLRRCAPEPEAALELSDALRGGGERALELANDVAMRALAQLAALQEEQECSMEAIMSSLPMSWRRLPPPRRYLALQLLARLLPPAGGGAGEAAGGGAGEAAGGGAGEAAGRLLEALAQAQPGQGAAAAQSTDTLRVLVMAAKLQVLFRLKKKPHVDRR